MDVIMPFPFVTNYFPTSAGVCSGWSRTHYKTFDGEAYSFKEDCSYYLVKEIITKHNLTIIVNNQACEAADSSFCPQALTVQYRSYTVVLTQLKTSGTAENVVSDHPTCVSVFNYRGSAHFNVNCKLNYL